MVWAIPRGRRLSSGRAKCYRYGSTSKVQPACNLGDEMPLYGSEALKRIRDGKLTLGLGVHHVRGSAVPLLAKAAGYDWLFIDAEHGAISTPEIAQIALAALPTGVVPIVRICTGALDEGSRALDNGALGIVVPHVDTPA